MKPVEWLGSSKADVRAFPEDARTDAGWQLELVQRGDDPDDWKPMKTVGQGVREIRIREASGAFRVIYLATLEDRVLEIGRAACRERVCKYGEISVVAVAVTKKQ